MATDEEWWARSIESILDSIGYSVEMVVSESGMLQRLATDPPDLIILPSELGGVPGIELCRVIRGLPLFDPCTPIVLTSPSPVTREQRIAGYHAGAWEWFGIPFDVSEFAAKLAIYARSKHETDRARAERLSEEGTDLYSRRALLTLARNLVALLSRGGSKALAAVVIGTEAQDPSETDGAPPAPHPEVVRRLARALPLTGRGSDFAGFLDPEELVILAPDTGIDGARRLAERMLTVADSIEPPPIPGRTGDSRLVAGCAVLDLSSGERAPELLFGRARAAFQRAQRPGGSDRVELASV